MNRISFLFLGSIGIILSSRAQQPKKKKYENDEERNMPLVIYKRSFPLLNYTITLRERFINRLSYWQTVCIGYTLKVIVR